MLTGSGAQARAATNAAASTSDDWELDPSEIAFHDKIASGAFGDLYRGVYCGQDVAIKILRNVQTNTQQFAEFQQVPASSVVCGTGLACSGLWSHSCNCCYLHSGQSVYSCALARKEGTFQAACMWNAAATSQSLGLSSGRSCSWSFVEQPVL